MKHYALCSWGDLNEIQEQLNSMEDGDYYYYDMIAPNTQNLELQDEAEDAQDLHPDLTESYGLTEQPILNEISDDEYRHMVQILNKEQKQFFYHILHLIKTLNHPFYCFLTGGASVGKSLLTKLKPSIRQH